MADDLKRAITTIRDGLKLQIDRSEKGKETAFTARSRDLGIADPDIQRDVSNAQLVQGAMGAAYLAADYFLDPDKYSAEALKDKASRTAVARVVQEGEKLINNQLPEGLNLNIDYKGLGFEDVAEGRLPAVGASFERPVELGRFKGTAGIRGSIDPESKGYGVRAEIKGRFAKGGKVKKYAKGGHVKQYSNAPRKPRLK